MRESVERANSMRHDMKSHLAALKGIINNNGDRKATDYLDTLLEDVAESALISDTGNVAFDSIVNYKLKDAARENIKLETRLSLPATMNVQTPDLAAILGNLLDNALDAVARVDDKRITLRTEHNKGNLFIKVENTFDGEVAYAGGKEKSLPATRKPGGGHGLRNVRRAVEKYNGYMDISHEGNVFSAGVLLYLNAADKGKPVLEVRGGQG